MPDIAFPEQQDAISAKGYSLGYIGSVILLVVNLAMVMKPDIFGITGSKGEAAMKAMRYSFVMVGVWWILFSQYTYYYLPKGNKNADRKLTKAVVFNGFKELKKVWGLLEENIPLRRYLLSFFVYSMAVQTVMLVATYFGAQEIQWESKDESHNWINYMYFINTISCCCWSYFNFKSFCKIWKYSNLIVINCIWVILCVCCLFYIHSQSVLYHGNN